jgi:hypothetical protein
MRWTCILLCIYVCRQMPGVSLCKVSTFSMVHLRIYVYVVVSVVSSDTCLLVLRTQAMAVSMGPCLVISSTYATTRHIKFVSEIQCTYIRILNVRIWHCQMPHSTCIPRSHNSLHKVHVLLFIYIDPYIPGSHSAHTANCTAWSYSAQYMYSHQVCMSVCKTYTLCC